MTTAQINKKYDRFIVVFTSNGQETEGLHYNFEKFGEVKKYAIEMLSARLDRHHGRGDHSVTVYGALLVDSTTPEEYKVGFGRNWVVTKDEPLFTL